MEQLYSCFMVYCNLGTILSEDLVSVLCVLHCISHTVYCIVYSTQCAIHNAFALPFPYTLNHFL